MLNLAIGTAHPVEGRSAILTGGERGFAAYGPYEALDPGRYVVLFFLQPAGPLPAGANAVCAVLDVAVDAGNTVLASARLFHRDLGDGRTAHALEFTLPVRAAVEFRVWTGGRLPLVVEEYRRLVPVPQDTDDVDALVAANLFPAADATAPAIFRDQLPLFQDLYRRGMAVQLAGDAVILSVAGVSLNVRQLDDLNFVGEVFVSQAYNLKAGRPFLVVDVGLNIGLTSLMLATKPEVAEIQAFEPFPETFARAAANLRLNPALASKITAHNLGLSDHHWDGPLTVVPDANDSGARSTIAVPDGQQVHLVLHDAADAIRPLIERAEAAGLAVAVKLDCEGSEFAVMRSLAAAGLVGRVHAFMVEWHAIFPELTQEALLAPLREAGFVVFDQSAATGNGFFYAVRMAA